MNASEQAKKLTESALTDLASALAHGQSTALSAYLAAMSRFHHYSWGNVLLILAQKPDATRVAGFGTWKTFGRFVRKGEKGIVIIAPMLVKPKAAAESEKESSRVLRFKAVYVFDVTQTDGEALPEFARVGGDPNGHTDKLKALIAAKNIRLEYAEALGGAMGRSHGGFIQVLASLPPAEEFSVLTHELAHELLHKGDRRRVTSKTVRETEAEAVAFVVSQAIGLETGTAAVDYIRLYDGDKDTLAESLDNIQRTAAEILGVILQTESHE